jgi:hypothetical protein
MHRFLAATGAFLVGVVWMDLMFDVQAAGSGPGPLPEPVLASIASYYRRVTTDAHPMSHLIGVVMACAVVGSLWQASRDLRRGRPLLELALCAVPIALAGLRVFPNAVRLGARADSIAAQSDLARAILHDHVLCLALIGTFAALQVAGGRREPRRSVSAAS